ncbi:MAG: type II secretion system F family protein [Halobacteria archaeon]|nr:type II secretion system F family protein [Halobacteria archaeon]
MIERIPPFRVAIYWLGELAERIKSRYYSVEDNLRSARMPRTYRSYMSRTLLYSALVFLGTLGVVSASLYVFWDDLVGEGVADIVVLAVYFSPVVASTAVSYSVFRLLIYLPRYRADTRARQINLSLTGTVSIMFTLSRGGMSLPRVIDTISARSEYFGTSADELSVASHDMEYFGMDVVTALRELGDTTASDEFADFVKNLVSVFTSVGDISDFLEERVNAYYDEAEQEQKEFLTKLGLIAEFYVVVFVAGPLFVIVTLIVLGFVGGTPLLVLRAFVYLVLPLAGAGLLVFLDAFFTNPVTEGGKESVESDTDRVGFIDDIDHDNRRDGETQIESLRRGRRLRSIKTRLSSPLESFKRRPVLSLYLGVFVGFVYLSARIYAGVTVAGVSLLPEVTVAQITAGDVSVSPEAVRYVDDALIEASLIPMFLYALFHEIKSDYLRRVEDKLPDFLERLADLNEAGATVSESLRSLSETDLGVLNPEIDRMERDIRWNTEANTALRRFANRVRSPMVSRAVVLMTNATKASGRLEEVLNIASREAGLRRRLAQERRSEMFLYTVVIYLSFVIFLVILAILDSVFLPAIPQTGITGAGTGGGVAGTQTSFVQEGFSPDEYRVLFYHAGVIQALLSGLIAGKMGEGRVASGVKHAFIMVSLAYVTFTFFLHVV